MTDAERDRMIKEMHARITGGTAGEKSINGELAEHASRILRLEGYFRWILGVVVASLTSVLAAFGATFHGGPHR